jgi:NADP-dependent aldehyde dehydrogenase
MSDLSYDVRTGTVVAPVPTSTADLVCHVVARAAAAAPAVAAATPAERRRWLVAVADALESSRAATQLVRVADRETALGEARLTSELVRCAGQLRFYGDVGAEASYLRVTVDHATETTPDLRRMQVPLGPVAVLGASNFPFAFGALGNDTGSALAAGCPVVAKAHPAHPETSALLATVATDALAAAGAPEGAFALVAGFEAGEALVRAPEIAAVAFTGSQQGGMAVWRLAGERDEVIPVYAEMGTVNPVVMTTGAAARTDAIAAGFVGSFTLGAGQFCTKPGLLLAPAGYDVPARVAVVLRSAGPTAWLLTEGIAAACGSGVTELVAAGARVIAQVPGPAEGWSADATVLCVPAAALTLGSRLLEECFGPVALVAEYADQRELGRVVEELPGALAASVMSAGPEDPETPGLVAALSRRAGRVAVDDWPTGVAYTWAQQHGGPWPATTFPSATSVGAAALDRFTRPVTWQSAPASSLPAALREDNPWRLPRRVDGRLVP